MKKNMTGKAGAFASRIAALGERFKAVFGRDRDGQEAVVRSKRTRLTGLRLAERDAAMVKRRAEGASLQILAEEFGVSVSRVSQVLAQPKSGEAPKASRLPAVVALYRLGKPQKDIAVAVGMSRSGVSTALLRAGERGRRRSREMV